MAKGEPILRNVNLPGRGPGTKAVLLVLLATASVTLAMGAVAIRSWYAEIQSRVAQVHPAVLAWSAESLGDRLDGAQAEIVGIARASVESAGRAPTARQARELLGRSATFSALVFFDAVGFVAASAGEGAPHDRLLDVLKPDGARKKELFETIEATALRNELASTGAASLRLFAPSAERAHVLVSAPLVDARGRVSGSVHGLMREDALSSGLRSDLLGVGVLRLADADGRIVAQAGDVADDPGALHPEALQATSSPRLELPWHADGAWTVRSARALDQLGMSVVAEQRVERAFGPMIVAAVRILGTGLVLTAIFTLVAGWMSVRLRRRLQVLVEGIRNVAKDDYSVALPTTGANEQIDLVYRGLNALVERLAQRSSTHVSRLEALSKQNVGFQKQHEMLAKLSVTDGLTELHNHRYFQDQLGREIKRLTRTNHGLSILIIDIDDFKKLNDTFGHAAGDQFLKQLARILKESVRDTDLLARYGGEEFVVVATATQLDGAEALAEKLRTKVAETSFIVDESMRPRRVTISIGVAQYHHSRTELFASADAALYRAKAAGKNCVMVAETPEESPSAD